MGLSVVPWGKPLVVDYPNYHVACAVGGRGRGASMTGAAITVKAMLQYGHNVMVLREHQRSIKHSNLNLIKDMIRTSGYASDFDLGRANDILCTATGAVTEFRGIRLNLDDLRSLHGYQFVWFEEPHKCTDEQLDVIMPSLRDEGITIFASWNPYLPDSAVERLRNYPGARVEFRTYKDNPYFPDVLEVERQQALKDRPPEIYEWIWDGAWRPQAEDAYFHYELVHDAFREPPVELGHGRTAGIDIAGSLLGDYTAIVVLDGDGQEVLVDRIREPDLHKRVQWLYGRLTVAECNDVVIDCTGGRGQAEMEALNGLGVDCTEFIFTRQSKSEMLNDLRMSLSNRELRLANNDLKKELLDLGEQTQKALTGHDDLVMALGMANRIPVEVHHVEAYY